MAKRSADKPDFRAIDRLVRALPVPPTGQRTYKEPQLRALGLTGRWLTGLAPRITARGARIWTLGYRAHGIERRHTIGSIEAWSAEAAWHEAANLRRIVDQGGDPQRDRRAERTAPTIDDLADRFELEHMPRLRPGSQDEYRRLLRIHIRPALGRTRVAELRHADIDAMHRKIAKDAPYSANRAVAVVSKMLSLAIKWEWREGANPARGIERAQEHKRERFLTGSEIARLGAALDAHPETASANVVRLLLLTGARRGEVLSARWDQFDLSAATWVKPASVTKQRKTHRLPLSAPALQLLATMKAAADRENERRARYDLKPIPYLFPGKEGQALTTIKHFWAAIIRQADLPRLRVHDLRHTHASILASLGLSLPVIGRLLGHTQAATTARYAHLLADPLRAATERAGAFLTEAGRDAAEVVPLLRKRFQK